MIQRGKELYELYQSIDINIPVEGNDVIVGNITKSHDKPTTWFLQEMRKLKIETDIANENETLLAINERLQKLESYNPIKFEIAENNRETTEVIRNAHINTLINRPILDLIEFLKYYKAVLEAPETIAKQLPATAEQKAEKKTQTLCLKESKITDLFKLLISKNVIDKATNCSDFMTCFDLSNVPSFRINYVNRKKTTMVYALSLIKDQNEKFVINEGNAKTHFDLPSFKTIKSRLKEKNTIDRTLVKEIDKLLK